MKCVLFLFFIISTFISCSKDKVTTVSDIDKIITEAQNLPLSELYKRAADESNGKTLYCIGNSSRGASAIKTFTKKLQEVKSDYSCDMQWYVPQNTIFQLLITDSKRINPKYSLALIQDGEQIQRKMINTHIFANYIPKEWQEVAGENVEDANPFALQTLNKVFEFNNQDNEKIYNNCWDFVLPDNNFFMMGIDIEPIGRNFLYMLTQEKYAGYLQDAFTALDSDKKAIITPILNQMSSIAKELGFTNDNAKYALTFIRLLLHNYTPAIDDMPICTKLTSNEGIDECGLLVYSKLRSIKETESSSINYITVAAYQDNYKGIGGFAYKHYLQVLRTAPLPWTACAFIAHMTVEKEGFSPWGKDMGGYPSNSTVAQNHEKDGYVNGKNIFPCKNDRGYDWWLSATGGRLVLENPQYCATVSKLLSDWLDKEANKK